MSKSEMDVEAKENKVGNHNKRKPVDADGSARGDESMRKRQKPEGVPVNAFVPKKAMSSGDSKDANTEAMVTSVKCVGGKASWRRPKLRPIKSFRDTIGGNICFSFLLGSKSNPPSPLHSVPKHGRRLLYEQLEPAGV